ncbi:site-specific integrase [Burkholderia vietnamiensis]|uniref:site-specific integrase n=1 Tax=Burkholderia vietnamiensis TaxID=60552 RepID=UPI0015891C1E|nr:site-specific integrase [Burkholderia vietnamiensis]
MTSNHGKLQIGGPYVGTLPDIVRCKGGHWFNPHDDIWVLQELTFQVTLRFDDMAYVGAEFKVAFKAALVWYTQNRSLGTAHKAYCDCRSLFLLKSAVSDIPIVEVTSVDILNYKAHVGKDREWRLGSVRPFLKKWNGLGYAGVTKDALVLLNQLRLKNHPKGVSVATMDPINGPFTVLEHEALQHSLNGAYGRNEVTLSEYVLCWLVIALGMRPTQYARLKVCDIVQLHAKDGASTYSVRMPRAKQRGGAREQFKDRLLTPQLGKLVFAYARQVESRFAGLIGDPTEAPLFHYEQAEPGSNADAYHLLADTVRQRLTAVLERLNVNSERTGKPVNLHATRFRQTIGTRAAEEGHGELVIAELLDHNDTQSVGVYVRSTPAIIERIDRAVAMQLAPLAQAFAGKLITGRSEASRPEASNQIRAPAIIGNFDEVSSCGKEGFCGFLKPVGCYTCTSFEPWLDGPHEQILTHLLAERERLSATGDARIAAINDRAILAVAEVILLCEAAHIEKGSVDG